MIWPRAVFERIGLFDAELVRNQDDELSYRLRKAGGRIFITTRMQSSYQNRQSIRTLARQFFQYGVWKIRVLQKHPKQMSPRHFVPPVFVLALAVTAVGAPIVPLSGWLCAAIAMAYVSALSAATVQVARQHGWRHVPLVLLVFVVMHVAWGSGFLVGAARFAGRWRSQEPLPERLAGAPASMP